LVLELNLLVTESSFTLEVDAVLGPVILRFINLSFELRKLGVRLGPFLLEFALERLDDTGLLVSLAAQSLDIVLQSGELAVFAGQFCCSSLGLLGKFSALLDVFSLLLLQLLLMAELDVVQLTLVVVQELGELLNFLDFQAKFMLVVVDDTIFLLTGVVGLFLEHLDLIFKVGPFVTHLPLELFG
jgi:hypothetical protein